MALNASPFTACFRYPIKNFKGQIRPFHKTPLCSGLRDSHTSLRCPRKVSAMAQFEPRKLKAYVDNFTIRMWDALPEPIKETPWKKAEHMLLQRWLFLGERALKWSLLAVFILSSLSDVVFSISRNRELLIPLGLFVGCLMVDFLKETSQELFQDTKDGDLSLHLLGIGFFFVLVKVVSLYFTLGGRVFLTHVGNGGLMQVLWLWKKLHDSNEGGTSSSVQDSSTAAM